jgi:hypothetical protein
MDQKEIEQVAKIFDSIITSPSQAVQDAFRNLTVLATLAQAEGQQNSGPFEKIFGRLQALEYELKELRREVQIRHNYDNGISDYISVNDIQLNFADTMDASSANSWIGNVTIAAGDTLYTDSTVQIFKVT